MCGIVGICGQNQVAERLIEGLRFLEYRGYDSAGLAVSTNGHVQCLRSKGKVLQLSKAHDKDPIDGCVGIAHTRWATHGIVNEVNAHPHRAGRVALVHNGIIENFAKLKQELDGKGRNFTTDTDTEVIAHLIDDQLDQGHSPLDAIQNVLPKLVGAYSLAIVFEGHPDLMIGARQGSPLVVGMGDGETYLGSDALALASLTNQVIYLEEGDIVELKPTSYRLFDKNRRETIRPMHYLTDSGALIGKGSHPHFMLKEIYEQPEVISHTIVEYINPLHLEPNARDNVDFAQFDRLHIVACGTAYYAALHAKYWFEKIAHLTVDVELASEFRYRDPVLLPRTLGMGISQSGETADTLEAVRLMKANNCQIGSVVNVATSSLARESDMMFPIHANAEIGVASTKAFTCQLATLAALALLAGDQRKTITKDVREAYCQELLDVPHLMREALDQVKAIEEAAEEFTRVSNALFIGRGLCAPLALEGALKLKELTYIHAEGYPAGELKHGPIALIEPGLPTIALVPSDELFDKTLSNMSNILSRHGEVIAVTDKIGAKKLRELGLSRIIQMPQTSYLNSSLIYALPLQLLAYKAAVLKGTDVDQPRNLAKSVTVE